MYTDTEKQFKEIMNRISKDNTSQIINELGVDRKRQVMDNILSNKQLVEVLKRLAKI